VKRTQPYHFFLLLLMLAIAACDGKKSLNERVSLWRNDKIPYGTWYAYNQLNSIFPDAEVVINKLSPDRYRGYSTGNSKIYDEAAKYDDKKQAYVIIAAEVVPDYNEVTAIMNLVGEGKHIFISTMHLGQVLLDSLRMETAYSNSLYNFYDSLRLSINHPVSHDSTSFVFPGRAMDNYVSEMDSSITTILGEDEFGRANFVKFGYESGGSIYIHLAPVAFTNFFLLHKNNKVYYDDALSYLPKDLEVVRWDDYFRYHTEGKSSSGNNKSDFNRLKWFSNQVGFSTALWLLLILFLILLLFESKRKQRIMPVMVPLKNASLDFVKTIGRLYFQRRDNKNLAHKMTAHFLDHVRGKYNIRASLADAEFEKRLAWKTGQDPAAVKDLLYYIRYVHDQPGVTESTLLELNHKLENFYRSNT
jgi:hypothetical protein